MQQSYFSRLLNSLVFKDTILILGLLLLLFAFFGTICYYQAHHYLEASANNKALQYTQRISPLLQKHLEANDKIQLHTALQKVLLGGDVLGIAIYVNDKLLYHETNSTFEYQFSEDKVPATEMLNDSFIVTAHQLHSSRYSKHKLILILNTKELESLIHVLLNNIFGFSFLSWALVALVIVWNNRKRAATLYGITASMTKIAYDGDLSVSLPISQARDEMGQMNRAFVNMIQKLIASQKDEEKNRNALKISEEKYKHIFRTSLVGIFRYDLNKRVFNDANQKLLEILHLTTLAELNLFSKSNKDFTQFMADLGHESVVENRDVEVSLSKKKVWLAVSAVRYPNEQFIDGIIEDITEQKEMLNKLNVSYEELDTFIYHASHDLRSPLKSVLGLAKLIEKETSEQHRTAYIKMIVNSVEKLDRLIGSLLTHTRNERVEENIASIDFQKEIRAALENLAFMPNMENVKTEISIEQNSIFLSDPLRLSIIFNNLLSNAVKYQKPNEPNQFIKVRVRVSDSRAYIEIQDNGEGIHEKSLGRLFRMFGRETETSEGAGLGLYIVNNTLRKLKGSVSAHSEYGVGTTFKLEIPSFEVEDN